MNTTQRTRKARSWGHITARKPRSLICLCRSIKSECLAQIIPLGERHLRTAVKEYTEHYHLERNHQGLENELIEDRRDELNIDGSVECRERLGGVLKYYDRRAA